MYKENRLDGCIYVAFLMYAGFVFFAGNGALKEKRAPGIKRSRMRQIIHTFRVNRNLQDTSPVHSSNSKQFGLEEQEIKLLMQKEPKMIEHNYNKNSENGIIIMQCCIA